MDLWPFDAAFANPENSVADTARLLLIAADAVMLVMMFRVARRVRAARQYAKYALITWGVSTMITEVQDLSHPASIVLVLDIFGCLFGLVFLWKSYLLGVEDEDKHKLR